MRIADRLAFDGAQSEALGGIEGRLLEPAVVEHQRLALPVLEIELAVVGTGKAVRETALNAGTIEVGAVDQGIERWVGGEIGHERNIGDLKRVCSPDGARSAKSGIPAFRCARGTTTAIYRIPRRSP